MTDPRLLSAEQIADIVRREGTRYFIASDGIGSVSMDAAPDIRRLAAHITALTEQHAAERDYARREVDRWVALERAARREATDLSAQLHEDGGWIERATVAEAALARVTGELADARHDVGHFATEYDDACVKYERFRTERDAARAAATLPADAVLRWEARPPKGLPRPARDRDHAERLAEFLAGDWVVVAVVPADRIAE